MKAVPARRGGFTLVEVLVVITLLAVLAALATGAFFRVRANQVGSATQGTLGKLNTGLDRRWKAVIDAAADDARKGKIPEAVTSAALGDADRARVIWTYLKLKNEFPTSFAEARQDIRLPEPNGPVVLRHRTVFDQLPGSAGVGANSPEVESAACLYLALYKTANRGEVTDLDGTGQSIGDAYLGPDGRSGATVPVVKDGWGRPVAFVRMAYPTSVRVPVPGGQTVAETNGPPLARAGVTNRDVVDPLGKLRNWGGSPAEVQANLKALWATVTQNHIRYPWFVPPVAPGAPGTPAGFPAGFPATGFPFDGPDPTAPANASWNWVPTTVSAGPDKEFGALFGGDEAGKDNILSFRLRREGAKGD